MCFSAMMLMMHRWHRRCDCDQQAENARNTAQDYYQHWSRTDSAGVDILTNSQTHKAQTCCHAQEEACCVVFQVTISTILNPYFGMIDGAWTPGGHQTGTRRILLNLPDVQCDPQFRRLLLFFVCNSWRPGTAAGCARTHAFGRQVEQWIARIKLGNCIPHAANRNLPQPIASKTIYGPASSRSSSSGRSGIKPEMSGSAASSAMA
jgi:hypothetical protein